MTTWTRVQTAFARLLASVVLALLPSATVFAHCDTLDGPVVADARAALERGDVAPVLKWVRPADEAEIRAVFAQAVAVRSVSPAARELADRHFFETLVRVHRAGEGAPYTGLQPAGSAVDPAVRLADAAIAAGSPEALEKALVAHLREGLAERWRRLGAARPHAFNSAEAGRAWVAAYVDFVHYAERLHLALISGGEHDVPSAGRAHEH